MTFATDFQALGAALDKAFANIPAPAAPFDPSSLQAQITQQASILAGLSGVLASIAQLNTEEAGLQQAVTTLNQEIATLLAPPPPPPAPPPVNHPPVWTILPTITFINGVASAFSIAPFATDPDNDPLTITKNAVALPPGVTYDAPNKRFVYDGTPVAATVTTSGNILTANDGRP